MTQKIRVIDSHTGGEPTRVIIEGGPDLGNGSLAQRRDRFRKEFDHIRSAVINEPRGSDTIVGALLCPPVDPSCSTGVIFFNNVGCLGMCGHGTIGVVATLSYLNQLLPGKHNIETPVGIVTTELHSSNEVSVTNIPSYRYRKNVSVEVDGAGTITGDIAWGGNWFFLIQDHHQNIALNNVEQLTAFTWKVREALEHNNITGKDNQEIDHIELFGPGKVPGTHSRNFVLCPGKAYDRSPCGTGTSAKLACLYDDGKLREGEIWKQESITGSVFEGSIQVVNGQIIPTIRGSAFITAESTLLFGNLDPLKWGIR